MTGEISLCHKDERTAHKGDPSLIKRLPVCIDTSWGIPATTFPLLQSIAHPRSDSIPPPRPIPLGEFSYMNLFMFRSDSGGRDSEQFNWRTITQSKEDPMTRPRRVLWAIVICVGIGIGGATSPILAQTLKEPLGSNIKPAPLPRHVVGTVKLSNTCGSNLTIFLEEKWFIDSNSDPVLSGLVLAGNTLVGLTTRTLGSSPVDPTTGNFDVQWSEIIYPLGVPWITARHAQTGETVSAYRILTLYLTGGNRIGFVKPPPAITFFGTEASKNVGLITVTCVDMGG